MNNGSAAIEEVTTVPTSRPYFSPMYHAAPPSILILFLSIRPRPSLLIRMSMWSGLSAIVFALTQFDTGNISANYMSGIFLSGSFMFGIVFLLLSDPLVDYRHEAQTPGEDIVGTPFWTRAYMVSCLLLNQRGIGWNYQVSPPVEMVLW